MLERIFTSINRDIKTTTRKKILHEMPQNVRSSRRTFKILYCSRCMRVAKVKNSTIRTYTGGWSILSGKFEVRPRKSSD